MRYDLVDRIWLVEYIELSIHLSFFVFFFFCVHSFWEVDPSVSQSVHLSLWQHTFTTYKKSKSIKYQNYESVTFANQGYNSETGLPLPFLHLRIMIFNLHL